MTARTPRLPPRSVTRKVAKGPKEAEVLRAVLRALERFPGVHALRLNAGLTVLGAGSSRRAIRGCEPGTPDILVMLDGGRVLWLEVKRATGTLSPSQSAWHASAQLLGHSVYVVRDDRDAISLVRGAVRS